MSSAIRSRLMVTVTLPQRQDPHEDRSDRQQSARDQHGGSVVQQHVLIPEQRILVALGPVVIGQVVDQPVDQQDDRDDREDDRDPLHASSPSEGRLSVTATAVLVVVAAGSANGSASDAVLALAPIDGTTARATRRASTAVTADSTPLPRAFDHVSRHIAYQV